VRRATSAGAGGQPAVVHRQRFCATLAATIFWHVSHPSALTRLQHSLANVRPCERLADQQPRRPPCKVLARYVAEADWIPFWTASFSMTLAIQQTMRRISASNAPGHKPRFADENPQRQARSALIIGAEHQRGRPYLSALRLWRRCLASTCFRPLPPLEVRQIQAAGFILSPLFNRVVACRSTSSMAQPCPVGLER